MALNEPTLELTGRTKLRTPDEWCVILGYEIMDPDGWDRTDFTASWSERLTLEEFERRARASTHLRTDPRPLEQLVMPDDDPQKDFFRALLESRVHLEAEFDAQNRPYAYRIVVNP